MSTAPPILLWFRRDFRLADHRALSEACQSGRPVVPVFILDEVAQSYGAAPKWRLCRALEQFQITLQNIGSRLVLRRGKAADVLFQLAKETGAQDIWWTRAYDPDAVKRDTAVKSTLTEVGFDAKSWPGHLLFEPWNVATKQGGFYKVYTPMWRAVKDREISAPEPAPQRLIAPEIWPRSERLQDWDLEKTMNRGAQVLTRCTTVGEEAAHSRLIEFTSGAIDGYKQGRDFPARDATSHLSEHLAWGEIGPRTIWHAGLRAYHEERHGAEHFLKELVWREFAYHLAFHTPHITHRSWRPEWEAFPWSEEEDETVLRWKQGRTGIPLVDAAMRELYVTGYMHNRGRMIVGSFLTKHLLKHWRIGQAWFEDCLIDWDPASNAMGWQWVAGCGPDAAPYFRVFNPETQAQKFDPDQAYIQRYVAELAPKPGPEALAFFEACPRKWGLTPKDPYPQPVVGLAEGRKRALEVYGAR